MTWRGGGGAASAVAMALLAACSPPRAHTTFLTSVDLVDMTERMARSFAADEVIGARGPHETPWVVSVARAVNRTNEIIPDREKWLYVGRLRARLAESALSRERSLVWVVPPERWPLIARELDPGDEQEVLRMRPTHLLAPEFHALTVTSGRGRSDTYLCSFQLMDLASGAIVWEDAWEVKRAVRGRTYD